MIPEVLEDMFFQDREELIIPARDVAVLKTEHHLYHAMLILSNSYVTLPVLDEDNHVAGFMTMAAIVRATTTITGDVMEAPVPVVREDSDLEDILREMQDANFICTVDEDGRFSGIITRKEVMSRVSRVFHGLNRVYEFVPKPRGRCEQERERFVENEHQYARRKAVL